MFVFDAVEKTPEEAVMGGAHDETHTSNLLVAATAIVTGTCVYVRIVIDISGDQRSSAVNMAKQSCG